MEKTRYDPVFTDEEYARRIYCLIFELKDDGGNADIQGVLDAINNALTDRQRIALESRFRHGNKLELVGKALGGVSRSRAGYLVRLAIRKLSNPKVSKKMTIGNKAVI